MADFKTAITKLLEHEGGYVNNPADKGGPTNFGITQTTYDTWMRKQTKNPNYKSTIDEIKNMSVGNAILIYKENYWDKVGGDKIKYYATAYAIFDQAVNFGPSVAIKRAQKVAGVTQDGVVGPKTLEAINKIKDTDFVNQFVLLTESAYRTIVANNPSQSVFLQGWLNRAASIGEYAKKFVGQINGTTVAIGGGLIIVGVVGFFLLKYLASSKQRA